MNQQVSTTSIATMQPVGAPKPAKLPAHVAAKLRALEIIAEDARTLADTTKDRLAKLHGQAANGQKIDRDEFAELEGAQKRRREQYEATTQLLHNLRSFIDKLPYNTEIAAYVRTGRVRLKDDTKSPQATVEAIRLEIINARTALFSIERAPLPRKEQEALIEAWVDRQLAKGQPRVTVSNGEVRLTFDGVPFTAPLNVGLGAIADVNGMSHQGLIAIGMWMAGVDRDTLVQRLTDMLPEPKGDTLSRDERDAQIAESRARILQLERDEEHAVTRYAEDGIHILRRPDASPEAVLGLDIGRKVRAAA